MCTSSVQGRGTKPHAVGQPAQARTKKKKQFSWCHERRNATAKAKYWTPLFSAVNLFLSALNLSTSFFTTAQSMQNVGRRVQLRIGYKHMLAQRLHFHGGSLTISNVFPTLVHVSQFVSTLAALASRYQLVHLREGSGSSFHFCPRPCSSALRRTKLSTHRKGPP